MKFVGELGDRSVCAPKLLENTTPRCVRKGGERGIEASTRMMNHMVQYLAPRPNGCKAEMRARSERDLGCVNLSRDDSPHGEVTRPAVLLET